MPTIVLLSGGLDSATVLAICRDQGKECHALSFRYGQRHAVELAAAAELARALGVVSHRICAIDAELLSGSALTGRGQVPRGRSESEIGVGIPSTYVPARNTLFAAHALALAEAVGAQEIALGINALDYSGYPDCRPEWLAAMEVVARLGTRAGVEGQPIRFIAPLIAMAKADIIRVGVGLGLDYGITVSCYDPTSGGAACGECDACVLRRRGFAQAGVADPTRYR
ncbi:MAG: 7-cyano-7-deazaguanine synthase QueC [Polyangia bacterium]|jgi:7-cyano-7-deazaguanine synthase